MIKGLMVLGTALIASAASTVPSFAQPAVQEPGMQSFYYPGSDLGIGGRWPQGGTNAMASSPNAARPPVPARPRRSGGAGNAR
jgi:hypothetical protein